MNKRDTAGCPCARKACDSLIYSGWLTKQGGAVKNWKVRFFCLDATSICYYEDDRLQVRRGIVLLKDISTIFKRSPPLRSSIFELQIPNRIYTFQARNHREMDLWIHYILQANQNIELEKIAPIVQKGIVKQGIMDRMIPILRTWQTLQFTLIVYPVHRLVFETVEGERKSTEIELTEIISIQRNEQENPNAFEIVTTERTLILQTNPLSEMLDWIRLLSAGIRDAASGEIDSSHQQLADAQCRMSQIFLQDTSAYQKYEHNDLKIIKQGWLHKRGFYNRSWRLRYFVLQMNDTNCAELTYYLSPNTMVPQGVIDVTRLTSIGTADKTCRIEIIVPKRVYELECDSELEAQEWITKIHFASQESCLPLSCEL